MTTLDLRFEVPADVDGLDSISDDDVDVVSTEVDTESDEEVDELIRPPDTFEVISTDIRFAADGTSVADVVAEIEDIPGAQGYEVRITKVG